MKLKKSVITVISTFLATSLMWVAVYNCINNSALNKKSSTIEKIERAYNIIQDEFILDYDEELMKDITVAAMVQSLGDNYSAYYPKGYYESLHEKMEGSYQGIGITVSPDAETGKKLEIVDVQKDTPAYKAGIEIGDIIINVEGIDVSTENYDKAIELIKGTEESKGKDVTITLIRASAGNEYTVKVQREKIVSRSVDGELFEDGVAYIHILRFDNETHGEFAKKIDEIGLQNIKYLILDLRDNGGGTLYSTRIIANLLLPKCVLTRFEYKDGTKESVMTSGKQALTMPMCVLVNGGSASASEVLTSALQDSGRATIIGEQTFGKAIAQKLVPFEYENDEPVSALYLTYARYLTPNGKNIHGKGITPDIIVETPEEYAEIPVSQWEKEKDVQLQKAIEKVKKSK